ncbi:MAG: hypothetical protein JZU58_18660 [Curvibacter lanceolatus]|uniref:hypothetical protein n=1 Tax=Curvibacter lanceolatus TaxID=86182 RepID=UPI0003A4C47F|nr:hypothetical protein [Curvibacter lanceolatus]MBV5294367.1 hypothetical protein [Curvibacter lanceolatus]
MQSMMRVVKDTQVDGRFFPRGAHVLVIHAGDSCLVLPDPDAHTTLCAVPRANLAPLLRFRVVQINHRVGLVDVQERWGLNADEVRYSFASSAPDCEMVELYQVSYGH